MKNTIVFSHGASRRGNENRQGGGSSRGNRSGCGQGRGLGSNGECICSLCGTTLPHKRGTSCTQMICPECGTPMMRKGQ
ncbi:MAG: hypothetical protein P9L92_07850 [Candidatus Electryonea clarkiae]|nr:hypothetical protein [Candidatus Electryonea clarkiae]